MEALCTAYPGYPWAVRVYGDDKGGGIWIRHLMPDGRPSMYGMNMPFSKHRSNNDYSASALKKEIIFMAGEWLERAGLARGANRNEDEPTHIEGVPAKHQPAYTPTVEHEVVIGEPDIRTVPRPQAVKNESG